MCGVGVVGVDVVVFVCVYVVEKVLEFVLVLRFCFVKDEGVDVVVVVV